MRSTDYALNNPNAYLMAQAIVPQQVGMGQVKMACSSGQLQALLGSCVGIGLIWKKRRRCALAHCLLPDSPDGDAEMGARYVSQAVPSLLRMIGAGTEDYADLEVVLAGGAHMLNARSSRLQVGQRNADAAQRYLREYGLNVSHCKLGGKCGRRLTIDCATCAWTVQDIIATQPQDMRHA